MFISSFCAVLFKRSTTAAFLHRLPEHNMPKQRYVAGSTNRLSVVTGLSGTIFFSFCYGEAGHADSNDFMFCQDFIMGGWYGYWPWRNMPQPLCGAQQMVGKLCGQIQADRAVCTTDEGMEPASCAVEWYDAQH